MAGESKTIRIPSAKASWNAPRLAEHFQTSRNVHRDLTALELASVPFWYDPDHGEEGLPHPRELLLPPW
ncbi:MAG: hypothetical protein L0Z62_09535 [Gemmataceae bacterium]|nr:hypothetical protein [Gemmataceae bacterium]